MCGAFTGTRNKRFRYCTNFMKGRALSRTSSPPFGLSSQRGRQVMRGRPEHSIKEAQRRNRLDRPLPGSVAKLSWSSVRLCQTVKKLISASRQMLFLDEPTAAVDAGAKRHLWKVWPGAAGPGVCSHSVLQPTLKLPKPSSKLDSRAVQPAGDQQARFRPETRSE